MTNTIARKIGEMQHQAIVELIQQTGIPFSRDAFKTVGGAQRVMQDIQDAGWTISEAASTEEMFK